MRKAICVSMFLCLCISMSLAMAGPAPKKPEVKVALAEKIFLIDNFESGNIKSPREWWTFDLEKAEAVLNVGNYSLLLSGPAKNWYAGGCGTYLAKEGQDLSKYSIFSMDVYGSGPGSGAVKIELFDDDNGNWQAEQDPTKNYAPVSDDKFGYEVKVDWNGWKRVSIPMADFIDENPLVGDDIWNPQQLSGSGGLLQMQFICIASSDKGRINYNLDNIQLSMGE